MIRKTATYFKRTSRTWLDNVRMEKHIERVLRETWWFCGIIPLYSRDRIVDENM